MNAVDLYLDLKGIVWFLDVGVVGTLEAAEKKCGPKVIGKVLASDFCISIVILS